MGLPQCAPPTHQPGVNPFVHTWWIAQHALQQRFGILINARQLIFPRLRWHFIKQQLVVIRQLTASRPSRLVDGSQLLHDGHKLINVRVALKHRSSSYVTICAYGEGVEKGMSHGEGHVEKKHTSSHTYRVILQKCIPLPTYPHMHHMHDCHTAVLVHDTTGYTHLLTCARGPLVVALAGSVQSLPISNTHAHRECCQV